MNETRIEKSGKLLIAGVFFALMGAVSLSQIHRQDPRAGATRPTSITGTSGSVAALQARAEIDTLELQLD